MTYMASTATIIIPTRNAADFLEDAVSSVLKQKTTYSYKIVIINDGSTDNSPLIAQGLSERYQDVKFFNSVGSGISDALNYGICLSDSKYIIRHDADDLMMEGKLQIQIGFMESHPDCVILGTQIEAFGISNPPKMNSYPLTDRQIRIFSFIGNPFAHPTVIFRTKEVREVGLYRKTFDGAEDYDLWLRLLKIGKGANLDRVLTKYRIHKNQVTASSAIRVQKATNRVQIAYLKDLISQLKLGKGLILGLGILTRYLIIRFRKVLKWM